MLLCSIARLTILGRRIRPLWFFLRLLIFPVQGFSVFPHQVQGSKGRGRHICTVCQSPVRQFVICDFLLYKSNLIWSLKHVFIFHFCVSFSVTLQPFRCLWIKGYRNLSMSRYMLSVLSECQSLHTGYTSWQQFFFYHKGYSYYFILSSWCFQPACNTEQGVHKRKCTHTHMQHMIQNQSYTYCVGLCV